MTMTVASGSRDFADPRIPNRNECVLRYLVDRWADERPDKTHVIFEDGEEWSYAELRRRVSPKRQVCSGWASVRGTTLRHGFRAGAMP